MNIELTFRFILYGEFSGHPNEYNPITLWRSTTSNKFIDCQQITIQWENEKKQISKEQTVTLTIFNANDLRKDDNLWMQCIVESINDEEQKCKEPCGFSRISLYDLIKTLKSKKMYHCKKSIFIPSLLLNNKRLSKGYIEFDCIAKDQPRLNEIQFNENEPSYLHFNEDDTLKDPECDIIPKSVKSMYYPYNIDSKGFKATDSFVEFVRAPYFNEVVPMPGFYYFLHEGGYECIEYSLNNLADIALQRSNITKEWFITQCNRQFSMDNSLLNDEFITCTLVVCRMISLIATSLYYKTDVISTPENEIDSAKKPYKRFLTSLKERPIESFNDALLLECGDCEDFSSLIHRISSITEKGDISLKNNKHPAFKYGSWKSETLIWIQRILHIYVCCACLGTIKGFKASETTNTNEEEYTYINSQKSKEIDSAGGHLWCELIPTIKFEKLVNRCNPNSRIPLKIYPNEIHFKWESFLPHLVAEGTGLTHPFTTPFQYYYKEQKSKEKAIKTQRNILDSLRYILKGFSDYTKLSQYEQVTSLLEDIPDVRYNNFYLKTSSIFTDKLLRLGYDRGEFMTTLCSPRMKESNQNKNKKNIIEKTNNWEWEWGVELRDRLNDYQDIGFVTNPSYTKKEWDYMKLLSRQITPPKYPMLNINNHEMLITKYQPILSELNTQLQSIVQNRSKGNDLIYIFIVYNIDCFIVKENEEGLSKPILKNVRLKSRIVDCKCNLEIITESIVNVRIDFVINE